MENQFVEETTDWIQTKAFMAGFEIRMVRKWQKYVYLYFLPAGDVHPIWKISMCFGIRRVILMIGSDVLHFVHACVLVGFHERRQMLLSLLHLIGLFVGISSMSFLLPPTAYPARCGLLVTTLLVGLLMIMERYDDCIWQNGLWVFKWKSFL